MIEPPKVPSTVPEFAWPARFDYEYRWKWLGWLLEGHAHLREALLRAWPSAIRRNLAVTERIAEIPFALRGLRLAPGSRVLDVGSRWSALPLHLASLDYRTVAVDIALFSSVGQGTEAVECDMRRPPFKPRSFDGAVMVSTLEHVGIGFYDPQRQADDDVVLMRELHSLVIPGGILVLTVPYGRPAADRHQRVYDRERLQRVTEGWHWEESCYWVKRGSAWQMTDEGVASMAVSVPETRAVAALLLRRT